MDWFYSIADWSATCNHRSRFDRGSGYAEPASERVGWTSFVIAASCGPPSDVLDGSFQFAVFDRDSNRPVITRLEETACV